MAGHKACATSQWLGHRAFGAVGDDRGADALVLAAGCREAYLDELAPEVVAVEVMPFALDLMHEQVEIPIVVQVSADYAAAIARRIAARQVGQVRKGAVSAIEEQLVAFVAAEAAPFRKDLAVVPVQEALVADGLKLELSLLRSVTHGRRHHVAPVGASGVPGQVASDKAIRTEHIEASIEVQVHKACGPGPVGSHAAGLFRATLEGTVGLLKEDGVARG